ncbi:hypothetical protein CSA56_14370 [candidate division KSB3 bacterium]|uniref:C4-type zinc ribbon domain-containing protein n=1 Tax=candidate division KSB3 bacterium TaxID=2044937 RepID=A0A2G6KAS4_9BACT|nr:MAG: hypothetical protein CSA56_14370 [candidate division KSB3 bacterium]
MEASKAYKWYNSVEGERVKTPLETLIRLQEIDKVILGLQLQIDAFPGLMQQLDTVLNDGEMKVADLHSKIDEQEKARRSKEMDIESNLEQIKKYQGQLLQVKTNKEYSALLNEIKVLKNKNSLHEDDILELMESVERAKQALIGSEKELKDSQKKVQEEKLAKEAEMAALQQQLKDQQQTRDTFVKDVDSTILKEYTKLLKVRNGVAVAAVGMQGICSGCRVSLTPQMFAEVKNDGCLHRCPVCFRFLYWADDSTELDGE